MASTSGSGESHVETEHRIADEEMRRLGSKRKDFETAARELDDLRRRAGPKERVTPAQALRVAHLNIFERGEIIDFKDIYFCGTQDAKKHVGDLNAQAANFGYDDDRGDYNIVLGDHLAYRYEVIDVLGKGSFGQVVRCIDHKTGNLVAVKIIRNKKRFHQQALIEVNLLQKLKEWDPHRRHSVVNFTQSFYFRGHLCISTELLGINLYEFIKAHDFRGFSIKLIRRFTRQILSSLTLLQAKKVIHCDLKPENILLVHPLSSDIRVIDFGSSCFENEKVYTYIQSRFYRSPEVILGMSYGMPIDMWSLGCILAELYTGYPIFPGENEQEQLACIMEVFGPPEKHLIEKSTRKKLFFDSLGKPRITVSSKGRRRRPSSKELRQVLKCDDEAFLDFISRCLRWDPARRLSPSEALRHEFMTGHKLAPRTRPFGAHSPGKRVNTLSTPTTGRPLPEPPGTSFKNGTFVRSREPSNSSPIKASSGKRHSTVSGLPPSTPAKRGTNTTTTPGSALPRVSARSLSGKPDLATAAAATSLVGRAADGLA
jgi:dual specificity tyrosine-phosphorylation-regulated kinase 2/3/4